MKLLLLLVLLLSSVGIQAQEADTYGVKLPDADELHITVSEEELPLGTKASYMRIVLDRTIKADEWTLFAVPSQLDGYYFGADAERYKVQAYDLSASPVNVKLEKMDDADDFAPNQVYLVKSKGNLDKLVALTPGISTAVVKAEDVSLLCLSLNDFDTVTNIDGMTDGKVFDADKMYDLNGRVSKSVKGGIYIINGKKVFVR